MSASSLSVPLEIRREKVWKKECAAIFALGSRPASDKGIQNEIKDERVRGSRSDHKGKGLFSLVRRDRGKSGKRWLRKN